MMRSLYITLALLLAFASPAVRAQTGSPCPSNMPATVACYVGADSNDAHYFIAVPQNWNRILVMHVRGGPYTQHLTTKRSLEDATRWAIWAQEGYAYAASEYRRGGYGARMAAEDTDNLRRFFIAHYGEPRRTILHGQSWGGLAGGKTVELYAAGPDGKSNYDGALLTSGMLAGATRGYDFRLDLRAVYQYYCRNHPRPDEPQYPLWEGLPGGSAMTPADLRKRIGECTGLDTPAAQRTAQQQSNLTNILTVIRIPERSLRGHLNWATFMFADIVHNRLNGRNPFSNEGVRYTGSTDDDALNAGVARYRADPSAVADLAQDSDLTGKVTIPTVTMHAIDDPTAFVETESAYRAVRSRAGTQGMLVQTFTDEHEHSYLSTPEYAAAMRALLAWIDDGRKPTPQSIAADCEKHVARYAGRCAFDTAYQPRPYDARVPARQP